MRWSEIEKLDGAPTYRQMDHWTTQGLIRAQGGTSPGTGTSRDWSVTQVREAFMIKQLSDLGIRLDVIRRIMAETPDVHGYRQARFGPRFTICIG